MVPQRYHGPAGRGNSQDSRHSWQLFGSAQQEKCWRFLPVCQVMMSVNAPKICLLLHDFLTCSTMHKIQLNKTHSHKWDPRNHSFMSQFLNLCDFIFSLSLTTKRGTEYLRTPCTVHVNWVIHLPLWSSKSPTLNCKCVIPEQNSINIYWLACCSQCQQIKRFINWSNSEHDLDTRLKQVREHQETFVL